MARKTDDAAAAQRAETQSSLARRWERMRKGSPRPGESASPLAGPNQSLWEYADTALGDQSGDIRVDDIKLALEYLTRITGDPAFETARLALNGYPFHKSGLERAAKTYLEETGRRAEDAVLPMLDPSASAFGQAEHVASMFGVAGNSLENATDKVRKAFGRAKRSPNIPKPYWLFGDTGRWLRIKLLSGMPPSATDQPPWGVFFDEAGLGKAPDNVHWRRMIAAGVVALLGYTDPPLPEPGKNLPQI